MQRRSFLLTLLSPLLPSQEWKREATIARIGPNDYELRWLNTRDGVWHSVHDPQFGLSDLTAMLERYMVSDIT